jgi:hypothetical protein
MSLDVASCLSPDDKLTQPADNPPPEISAPKHLSNIKIINVNVFSSFKSGKGWGAKVLSELFLIVIHTRHATQSLLRLLSVLEHNSKM